MSEAPRLELALERTSAFEFTLPSHRFSLEAAHVFDLSCLNHVPLARPWHPGHLGALVESALGRGRLRASAPGC